MARLKSSAVVIPEGARPVYLGRDGTSGPLAGYVVGEKKRSKAAVALWSLAGQRVVEIERLIRLRHPRGATPTEAAAYLLVTFNHIVLRERAASARTRHARPCDPASVAEVCRGWARALLRRPDPGDVEAAIEKAVEKPRRYRADTVAEILSVTRAEREGLDLRTIGAVDFRKADRKAAAKEKKRQRDRDRYRRKHGGVERSVYLAEVASEARRLGISRQALYARRKRERERQERESLRVLATYKSNIHIQGEDPSTPSQEQSSSRRRAAEKPPRRNENSSSHRERKERSVPTVIFIPVDPARREKIARLFEIAANAWAPARARSGNRRA